MEEVPEKISFPGEEEKVLEYWDKIDAFHTSVKLSEGKPEYSFYDGPPFATGLPHYGHILAGTIKDTVTRYAHQTGHHVIRRFGWDCHGLPIEFEIDKLHGIKTREDVLKMGIPKYNAECRAIVMRYSKEWQTVVKRLGRWIDMENNYKTMDLSFMESVWWVFSELWEKDMVYRGFKVMPYSTGCTTPLSNFEATSNYKDVSDPAIYISFPLVGEENVSFVAWTTTPWTLPSNLALCVNPTLEYVQIVDNIRKKELIMLKARLPDLYKAEADYTIKKSFLGKDLAGKSYVPLFPYFAKEAERGAFKVLVDGYVTADSGTGIVHCAPAFGEDDYRVCINAGVVSKGDDVICPVDADGRFTPDVVDYKGIYVKDADKTIIKDLKTKDRLIEQRSIVHSYPFCWRSDTPIIYKAVPSWFIKVEQLRDQLLENNKQTYWVPEFVQEKRFANWLKDARDWAVSRNRYWGTPLPVWLSEDGTEKICIKSVQHLFELSGVMVNDLHRETIDQIEIKSPTTGKILRRTDEVFDCWFESGSMPYAQVHYPFENKELFEKSFPADFIAEGIDQTRGWFYTLLVLSTALKNKPPFKNLIANGLVLAADGKKMSKRLKNYPDPLDVVNQYGADSLRLYLINSPVVRAETLKFNEKGVRDVIKDVFLPWFNAYRFFVQNALRHSKASGGNFIYDPAVSLKATNIMDKWILAACQSLIKFVRQEMQAYRLYTVVPKLVQFIGQLTNWYVRLNRRRLKGATGAEDASVALNILFEVLYTLNKTMAPFTPYFTEYVYQNLRLVLPSSQRYDSIHYEMLPEPRAEAFNEQIETAVNAMQEVIELGRAARDRKRLPIKTPLSEFLVVNKDAQYIAGLESVKSYIQEELNVRVVKLTSDEGSFVNVRADPERDRLGKRLRGDLGKVSKAIRELSHDKIREFQQQGQITLEGHVLTAEDLKVVREFKGDQKRYEATWSESTLVVLDCLVSDDLRSEGLAREVINRVQRLRKKGGLQPGDPVEVFYSVQQDGPNGKVLAKAIQDMDNYIHEATNLRLLPVEQRTFPSAVIAHDHSVVEAALDIYLVNSTFAFNEEALVAKYGDFAQDVRVYVLSHDYFKFVHTFENGVAGFLLNDKRVELKLNEDIFLSAYDRVSKSKK